MRKLGLVLCGVIGGAGATAGFFAPNNSTTGSVMAALAVALGIADFLIKDSLKLVDDRIKQEVGKVRTAFRVVPILNLGRVRLLRVNFLAMACKGVAVSVAGLASLGKANPLLLSIGGASLSVGLILTLIILLSHESLSSRANEDAVTNAEDEAAKKAVERLGKIETPVDLPERKIIKLGAGKKPPSKKTPRKE